MARSASFALFLFALVFVAFAPSFSFAQEGECDCSTYECGCCIDKLPLIDSVCANVTWDAQDLSVTVSVSVDSDIIIEQTFTDYSPLSVCVQPPLLCSSICLEVEGLNITDIGACGELVLNLTCIGQDFGPFLLGDFYLGYDCDIPSFPIPGRVLPTGEDAKPLAKEDAEVESVAKKALPIVQGLLKAVKNEVTRQRQ